MAENVETSVSTKRALQFLISYLVKHKATILLGLVMLILVDTTQLYIPRVIQTTLDSIQTVSNPGSFIFRQSSIILGMAIAMMVLRFLWRFLIIGTSRRIERRIRKDVFDHILGLPFSFYNRTKTGEIMALLVNDISAIRFAVGPALTGMTDTIFLGTLTIAFMLMINVPLTLLSISPLLLVVVFLLIFGRTIQKRFESIQQSFADVSAQAQEIMSGIRIVKGFNQEREEERLFREKCDEYVEKKLRLEKLWGLVFPMVGMVASASIVVFLLAGGRLALLGTISIGEFISFSFYIMNLIWPMIAIGWVFNILQRGLASSKRIIEIIDNRSEPDGKQETGDHDMGDGTISIRELTFSYNTDRPVLKNINLEIAAGSSLGIMGKPGSGKTTLVSLLFRLFAIPDDTVFIGGHDINRIPVDTLRKATGYVPQDSFLFADTIIDNILLGAPESESPDDSYVLDRVRTVCDNAAITKDIESFSDGLKTILGERGITLSGGQKQRVALARALFTNPDLLILDDAFSAVDTRTEQTILDNIRPLLKEKTSLVIAHRVSTVKECDQIIVLDNGTIIEQGTHEQLVEKDGWYSGLYKLQQLEETLL
jgi:ATP-binding cassette subfamily B multidrug efflux pump